jgi:hypothetical protein
MLFSGENRSIPKDYFADLPASYSTRTGAMVFVAIDRLTRTVSFLQ